MPETDAHQTPVAYDRLGAKDKKEEGGNDDIERKCLVSGVETTVKGSCREELEGEWEYGGEADRCEAVRREWKIVGEVSDELQGRAATP